MDDVSGLKVGQFSPGRVGLVLLLIAAMFLPFKFISSVKAQAGSPTFVYQTINDGAHFEQGTDEVVDAAGNAYILGYAYDTNQDVMVVKLSPTGAVLYTTYLRGSQIDNSTGLALDGQGGLLVSGWTDSPDFPVVNAAQPVKDSRRSAFLTRLDTANGAILYSSFFGGNGVDEFHDVAVSGAGDIYLTGVTTSTDFPTVNPIQAGLKLVSCFCNDAFIVRFAPDAQTVLYSTYLGGGLADQGDSIGVDAAGNIYVAGITKSDDFPTANPIQAVRNGDSDVWAARISADGANLDYSTYLGGEKTEGLRRIAVDAAGFVTLTGSTNSAQFPTTPNSFQPVYGGGLCGVAGFGQRSCYDAFVTRLTPDGSELVYSTYMGGNTDDEARGVVVDSAGNAYVVGYSTAANFPQNGGSPTLVIFASSLDASGSQLRFNVTEFSATGNAGHGIALGPGDDVFYTGSKNAPSDLYAARLSQTGGPAPTPTPTATSVPPTPTPSPTSVGGSLHVGDLDGSASGSQNWKASVLIAVHDSGHNPVANVTVRGNWSNGASGSGQCVTNGSGVCSITSGNLRRTVKKAAFTISSLTRSGFSYTAAANHDPDGDSNGTTITIFKP